MKKPNLSKPPIPVHDAMTQAANWRHYCRTLLDKGEGTKKLPVIKAFFVPLADLLEVIDHAKNDSGKKVVGMRLYFRLENKDDDLSQLKAMVVPVINQPDPLYLKDWYQTQGTADEEEQSLIFDFTMPCPTECDVESPLFKEP